MEAGLRELSQGKVRTRATMKSMMTTITNAGCAPGSLRRADGRLRPLQGAGWTETRVADRDTCSLVFLFAGDAAAFA